MTSIFNPIPWTVLSGVFETALVIFKPDGASICTALISPFPQAYTTADRIADNAILFKLIAKTMGLKYGIMPSFMAKPWAGLPGCSGHVHVSLRDAKTGRNVFSVSDEDVKNGGRKDVEYELRYISKECEWFIAGVLDGLPDGEPCLALAIPNS
jgi:glutamine synthetase